MTDSEISLLEPSTRIAIVGAGAFGRFCMEAYGETGDIRVAAVVDPDPAALHGIESDSVRVYGDWRTVVDDPDIEALHIATPPFVRDEIVLAALEAGKAVFCEKPLALTLEAADEMIAESNRSGVALGVNYVMRHQPAYRLAAQLAQSGVLGSLRSFSFENYAQHVPADHWFWDRRRSGGIFVEHGVHFFDVLGQFAGPPISVMANQPAGESVEATVMYAGDAIGRFYHEFAFPRSVEYCGVTLAFQQGHIRIEGWIPTTLSAVVAAPKRAVLEAAASAGVQVVPRGDATQMTVQYPDRQASYRHAIVLGMRELLHSNRTPGYQSVVLPQDARQSLALALFAQRAIEMGGIHRVA